MGCGASQDPNKEANLEDACKDSNVTETPVETFDGTSLDGDSSMDGTSRKTRDDTIAQNKRDARDDHYDDPSSSSPVPAFSNSPGTVPRKGPVLEEPPNPFAVNRRDENSALTSPVADQRGAGYMKDKDTKKRGGFDPEKYRAANGRAGGMDNTLNQDGPMQYSSRNFNNQGSNPNNGNSHGQQNNRFPVNNGHNLGIGHEGDYGSRQGGQWQQKDYIAAGDFNSKPKAMAFSQEGAAAGFGAAPGYSSSYAGSGGNAGSWGADARGSSLDHSNQALNRTDEQELDDILDELGCV